MRALVISGTGFIGGRVVRVLADAGHRVAVFHRGEREAPLSDVLHIHGDRADLAAFRADFARFAPDVVLDMHAMTEADGGALIAATAGVAPRLALVSSIDVYRAYGRLHGSEPGTPEPTPLTEDSPLRERLYPYRGDGNAQNDDYDKIPIERMVLEQPGARGTVLRLPAVHGEGDPQRRLRSEVRAIDAGRMPFVPDTAAAWRWPRAYVENVADAIALAVTDERAAGRVYNVAEPESLALLEWTRTVAKIGGYGGEVVAQADAPPEGTRMLNFAQDMAVDSSRIRRELGYAERIPPDEGIARAIAWEREEARRERRG